VRTKKRYVEHSPLYSYARTNHLVNVISPANSPRPSAQHLTLHQAGQFFPFSTSTWRCTPLHRRPVSRSSCASASPSEASSTWIPSTRAKVRTRRQHTQPPYTDHPTVIAAYSRSLRVVFISAIACFLIVNILVLAIKLPHLKRKQSDDEDRDDAE
jgi:hypothetical protein